VSLYVAFVKAWHVALLIAAVATVVGCGGGDRPPAAPSPPEHGSRIEVPRTPIHYTVRSKEEGSWQGIAEWAKFTIDVPRAKDERRMRYVLLALKLAEAGRYDAALVDFLPTVGEDPNRIQSGYIMNTREGLMFCIDQSPPTLAGELREAYKQDGVYVIG
jgi:hypothetical protein